ncbi:MAG: ABC-F family ATP-binding cassette domain-containing protein, partial [Lachnospiraceae bacterium]|nr:ABC-F family ATP-binding cassette domain-containing protein [Lachnospiraceae bacterium]
ANLLYLDEPTNHLDIISKEILEQAVSSYKGTVIYVSHDRYFINKTATRIMELKDKHFITFDGTYDYYLEKRDMLISLAENSTLKTGSTSAGSSASPAPSDSAGSRESWENAKKQQALQRKLENEFKKTEEEINTLEQRNSELDALMQLPENATVPSKLLELSGEHEKNDERLEILMKQWEELYERINQ